MAESFTLEEAVGGTPAQGPVDPELERQIARYEQMPSKAKPFTAADKYLNPNIPGHPEYNDAGKSPLQVLYQERDAQRRKGAPQGFSLEDIMGQEKKPEPAPGEPDTHGFWAHLTKGGFEGAYKEGLPNVILERMSDVKSAEIEFANDKLWEKEKARREAAGESTSDMAFWKVRKINEIVASHKKESPEQSAGEIWDSIKKAAVDDPGGFAAEMVRGFVLHPEFLFTPEALPLKAAAVAAKMGKTAAAAAKTGVEAAQIGAASAAESALEQTVASGKVDPTKTEFDAAMGALPVVAARALMPKQQVQVKMAAEVAIAKDAKAKGTEPSGELAKEIVRQTDEGVANGKTVQQAMQEASESVGVSKEAAEDAAKMVPEEPKVEAKGESHAVEERPVEEGDKPEHQRVDTPREPPAEPPADRGDRAAPGGEVKEAGPKPVEPSKQEAPKPKVPPGAQPLPEGVPNRFVTPDEARRVYEMVGDDKLVARLKGDKPIAMGALRARLANRMAGQEFADRLLKEAADSGVFGKPEAGAVVTPKEELVIPSPSTEAANTPAPLEAARDLTALKREIGWAEKGGRIVREQPKTIEEMRDKDFRGDVVGRTKWVPLSDFWPGRPDKKLTQRQADAAIDKHQRGEKLTPIEQRFIDYANEELKFREGELRDSAEARAEIEREAAEERLAIQEESHYANKEVGAVDPKVLALLGITAAVGVGEAIYSQDPRKGIIAALATGGVVAAGAMLHRSVKANGDLAAKLIAPEYRALNTFRQYWRDVKSGQLAAQRFAWQIEALVKDPKQREQITHWIQGDKSIKLSPEALQVAAAVEDFFKTMGEKGQKAGILPDELLEQYVTQLWSGLNKNSGIVRNMMQAFGKQNLHAPGMSPRTRFAMERQIPSYKAGMERGMVPTTLDIAKIVRIYADNINKAIANKNLVSALKREKTAEGLALVVRDTPEEIAQQMRQTAAILDKQWEGGGDLAKEIRDYAIRKAPREYVTIDNPNMRGLKVHQDIAATMKHLFDAEPHALTKIAYAAAVAAKRGIFSYSLFHVKSLADAMLGTNMRGWVNVLNGSAYKMLREGRQGDIVDLLVSNGLNVIEKPLEGDVTPFHNALKLLDEKYPIIGAPAKGMLMVSKAMDAFLWSTVHPTFKVAAGMAALEKVLKDSTNPSLAMRMADKVLGKRKAELSRADAARIAASFTNDVFGGLDWFSMANEVQNKVGRELALAVTSPRGRRAMQILMLAPDWTIATTRAMVKAIPGVSQREIAALHQGYVVRSALLYLAVANGMNYAFTGHSIFQNQDKTMVDLGDGRKMQLSKHFMEPIHWLLNPGQQALNKLGWIIKEPIEQATNKQWLSAKGAPPITTEKKGEEPVDRFLRHRWQELGHAVGSITPIPAQTLLEKGPVPALAGFFGFPIYGSTDEQYVRAAGERAEAQGKDRGAAEKRAQKRRDREKRKREAEQ